METKPIEDPFQEFAKRAAEKWNSRVGNGMEGLISTIASELRSEGWSRIEVGNDGN